MNKNEKELVVKCLGEAVVQVRESAGMTVEELSATGEDFGLSEICKIAKATGLKPNKLMGIHEALIQKAESE